MPLGEEWARTGYVKIFDMTVAIVPTYVAKYDGTASPNDGGEGVGGVDVPAPRSIFQ